MDGISKGVFEMNEEEIISFIKEGGMCKSFGCTVERLYYNGGLDNYMTLKCKYCGKEQYVTWQ